MVVPGVRSAAAHARCIELLEGGAFSFPDTGEGCIDTFIECVKDINYERLKKISLSSDRGIFFY
jgi:hypothetical protein